jgi:hypothetical protein
LAERWDGSSWSLKSTPNPAAPPNQDQLTSVSCPSSSLCLAVGIDDNYPSGFGQSWNGSEWKAEPALAYSATSFRGISCPTTSFCLGVGGQVEGGSTASGEAWYSFGGSWSPEEQSLPIPEGSTWSVLKGVSCTSETACTAVGSYVKEGNTRTLALRWNGSEWSVQTTPNPETGEAQLNSVSCASSTFCMATGWNEGEPFAEHWNGSTWSIVSVPTPSPSVQTGLNSVSCTSSTNCTAVGSYTPSSGANAKTLIERWNGTSWSIVGSPNASGEYRNMLTSVSCTSSNACIAVGRYVTPGSETESKTLIESWNGTEWTIQTSPNPEGKKLPWLMGVSCYSQTSCMAVGRAQKGNTEGETVTLAERYE